MPDRRSNIVVGFALRFLADNWDKEVEETLNDNLNDAEQPSITGDEELREMADSYAGLPY